MKSVDTPIAIVLDDSCAAESAARIPAVSSARSRGLLAGARPAVATAVGRVIFRAFGPPRRSGLRLTLTNRSDSLEVRRSQRQSGGRPSALQRSAGSHIGCPSPNFALRVGGELSRVGSLGSFTSVTPVGYSTASSTWYRGHSVVEFLRSSSDKMPVVKYDITARGWSLWSLEVDVDVLTKNELANHYGLAHRLQNYSPILHDVTPHGIGTA